MPQMSPIYWEALSMFSMIMVIILANKMFFYESAPLTKSTSSLFLMSPSVKWTW